MPKLIHEEHKQLHFVDTELDMDYFLFFAAFVYFGANK